MSTSSKQTKQSKGKQVAKTTVIVTPNNLPRSRVSKPLPPIPVSGDLSSYKLALTDPFNPKAEGAQVPDHYATPTTPSHYKTTVTLTCGATGNADLIVFPNMMLPAISDSGSISSGASGPWLTAGGNVANGIVYTPTNILANKVTNYRIVGMGAQIRGVSSMTSSQGRVVVGFIPNESYVYSGSLSTIGGQTVSQDVTQAACFSTWGVPFVGTGSSASVDLAGLVNLPKFYEFSMQNVCEKAYNLIPKIISPKAFEFRRSTDSVLGFNIASQSAALTANSGSADHYRCDGFETMVIGIVGGVAGQTSIQVDLIFHIEGAPNISGPIVSDRALVASNPLGFLKTLHEAAKSPQVSQIIDTVTATLPKLLTLF